MTRTAAPARPAPKPFFAPKPGTESTSLAAGVPLGAILPRKFTNDPELILLHHPRSVLAERYRMLVSRLESLGAAEDRAPQVLTVTSAVPAEGKTLTAVNLALALAEERDRSTLLVDADLRRPSVSRYLAPQPKLGLSEVLSGAVPLEHALLLVQEARLSILPAGSPTPMPLELLRSDYLATLIEELRRRYDHIVIDTPPAVPFADAGVLNHRADGALLVVRAGKTSKPMIERALESLDGGVVVGVILNDVELTPVDRYYYHYDDYDPDRYAARSQETT